ncbi:FecR family protein [Pseudodesulfovibrio sp. zrk46]|uniref:FecR family protein n=1 Tax=Pseudodesulfovibrio sp. zrk46 TaxID=2725288 RepID=UPI001449465B|nr:FecR family protein [Pseudodesulfovibrio sp. zrk46]QJB57051.1 FecR domain-containing protein [Pseudodesulfovibrio sp. zrk46]
MTHTIRLTTLALLIVLFTGIHSANASEPAIGTVTRIKTAAIIDGKDAALGTDVYSGSSISTDADGRLEVTFKDNTMLQVGGGSTFVIDSFIFDPEQDEQVQKAFFNLTKGSFRMVTSELIDANPEIFGVKTPLASIGIRGTDFWGGYLSDIEIDIVMLKGKGVIVTSMGGVVEIDEPGKGVSVPDPINHPMGFAKALQPPTVKRWSQEKLSRATATVSFE